MRQCRAWMLAAAALIVLGCAPGARRADPDEAVPSLKDDMRMPWSRGDTGFVREWLVLGPFPSPPQEKAPAVGRLTGHVVGAGFHVDYLQALGGEAQARPEEGDAVAMPDGAKAAWERVCSDDDILDFKAVFADQDADEVVAYAYAVLTRPEAGKAVLALGSDDSVKVWLNGSLVHEHRVGRGVHKDEDIVAVTFRQGPNALLAKVENGRGRWGLVLRHLAETEVLGLETGGLRPAILPDAPQGKPTQLVIETDTGLGKVVPHAEPVLVEAVAPGGRIVAKTRAERGKTVTIETGNWDDGPYEIRLSKAEPDGRRAFAHLPWYKGDPMKQIRPLLDAADRVPDRSADPADLRRRVLARLLTVRLGGDPRKGDLPEDLDPLARRNVHAALLEAAELDLGPDADVRPHGFVRLAWRDPVDDSPQFACAHLPPDYTPNEQWPLVVNLHGYNPANPEYVDWWSVFSRHSPLAEGHGVIALAPHGRANTSYRGIGDADVLRAIDEAQRRFSVDTARVYLMGYSMGGAGAWHVGTRHPERFAAIGPIYGGWDYRVWMDEDRLAPLTPRRRYHEERWSSFAQAEALLSTPVFVNHGDADELVDIDHSRYAVRMLQRWGYPIRYWEHPGKGHGALGCEDELLRCFLAHRLDENPRRVRVRAADLRTAAAHWVRVLQRDDPFAFIHVDARVADRTTVRLDTENVLAVSLTPGDALVDPRRPLRVVWNGRDTGTHAFAGGAVTLHAKGYQPATRHKTPTLAGPVDDLANTPFAIVVGTISKDPAMRRFCRLRAETERDRWREWQHAEPRYFRDTLVTDEHIRRYSLVLFGGPEANDVTRRLAHGLPLCVQPDAVTIDGRRFPAADAAVRLIYPNPLNPERYVCIWAATSPAGMYLAHQLPEQFDFALRDRRDVPEDGPVPFEHVALLTGSFDHNWRFQDRFAMTGSPAVRTDAPLVNTPTVLDAKAEGRRLHLSDLVESTASGSFIPMRRDTNWLGRPIRLHGRSFTKGIAVRAWHEPCTVTYDLSGGKWKRLRATLGIEIEDPHALEDRQKAGTRVFFVVQGDGRELYRSPTFHWDSKPVDMDVDVSGVDLLTLEVANETTWHCAASSADWADLRLEK